jgi:ABC-2 type transport system permease protein
MFLRLYSLVRKELTALLMDPRNRIILIAPPLLQLFVFSFASTLEVKNNALTIWNEDFGTRSTELVQRMGNMSTFNKVHCVHDQAAFDRDIEVQRSLVAVHIPEEYSAGLMRGDIPPIQIVADGRRSNSGQIVTAYLSMVIQNFYLEQLPAGSAGKPPSAVVRNWFNPNLHYIWFVIPSLVALLTTIMAMIITALSVARERELGTFDQLMVSPLNPEMILVGKAIPAFFVSMAEASLIVVVGVWLFGVPFKGDIWLLYASLSAYIFALVGIGLFISSLCHTQQQAILGVFCFMLPSVLLSGYASPIDNMPEWMASLTVINPLKHFLIILKALFWKDATPAIVWQNIYPLLIIAVVTMTASDWMFRRKSE